MTEDKNLSKRTLVIAMGVTFTLINIGGIIVVYYLTGTLSIANFILLLTFLPLFLILMKKTKGQ